MVARMPSRLYCVEELVGSGWGKSGDKAHAADAGNAIFALRRPLEHDVGFVFTKIELRLFGCWWVRHGESGEEMGGRAQLCKAQRRQDLGQLIAERIIA